MAVQELDDEDLLRSLPASIVMHLVPPRLLPSLWRRLLLAFGSSARARPAQSEPDVVRGRVTDDSARAVIAATVMITRGPDRLTQQTTTDSTGAYSSRFEQGTGDYLVYVNATGFKAERRRVQRQGTERELVADFKLARDLAPLAAVKVTAARPERASNQVRPTTRARLERTVEGRREGQISPSVAGDLNAIASTMSNVTMGPSGASILGSGSESNLTTLNGMGLAAGSVPRAARTETRVTGASFDATRGGFAGANIDVRLGPGDRFYQRRNAFITFDPPQLQFTDAVSRRWHDVGRIPWQRRRGRRDHPSRADVQRRARRHARRAIRRRWWTPTPTRCSAPGSRPIRSRGSSPSRPRSASRSPAGVPSNRERTA